MSNYQVGSGQTPIFLEVDINTFGLAGSRAIIVDVADGRPSVTVAHSVDATGDIRPQTIGFAAGLAGTRLSILTHINIVGNDDIRSAQAAGTAAFYRLNGGPSGIQSYNSPMIVVAPDNSQVSIHQTIDLL